MELTALLIGLAFGLAVGGAVAWALLRGKAQASEARYEEYKRLQEDTSRRLEEASEAKYQEARRMQAEMDRKLQDTFASLASRALATNSEAFLQLARESLQSHLTQAQGDLDLRTQAVEGLVKPLAEELKRIEQERQTAYGGLKQQTEALAQQTNTLAQALKTPRIRGEWGEQQLRNIVELTGMEEFLDYELQMTIQAEAGLLRPDMVIRLPNSTWMAVDSKAPGDAYYEASNAGSDELRLKLLREHAAQMRRMVRDLSRRSYPKALGNGPEFVVLVLPHEALLITALQVDAQVLADAVKEKVLICTPLTFFALLHAVRYGWQQERVAKNAEDIRRLGQEMYDRILTWAGHLERVGDSLEKAVKAHNDAVGSLEGRVLVSARRLKELGAGGERDVPELGQVDTGVRKLTKGEANAQYAKQ